MSQLKGVRVLELASVLAGPGVGQFFAELGAEVIKVENPATGGDVTRSWKTAGEKTDDRSAYFCSVNWGKRSIAIDLTSSQGKSVVSKLAAKSDIVIASYKPGDAEKLQVDYPTLSRNNPKLIYGQISGYGSGHARVGYDAIIQAEAGFMFMNGEPGGPSLKMPVALMDILAGHHLKEGLLLALLERATSGKGRYVEVSLIQAAVSSLANQATNWLIGKHLPEKQGSAHPNIAPYGDIFKTSDDKEIILAVGTDRQFADLCRVLNLEKLTVDPLFAKNVDRVKHRNMLNDLLASKIQIFSSAEMLERCQNLHIPAGIVQNMEEVFRMHWANELLFSNGFSGVKTYVGNPSSLPDPFLPPPHLGEHTVEILASL